MAPLTLCPLLRACGGAAPNFFSLLLVKKNPDGVGLPKGVFTAWNFNF